MSDLENFRQEIRAWLEANCPAEMREPVKDEDDVCWGGRHFQFKSEAQKTWLERCAAKGYTVPDWPKPYGGAGLSPAEAKIWREEMNRIGARSDSGEGGEDPCEGLGPAAERWDDDAQARHGGSVAR